MCYSPKISDDLVRKLYVLSEVENKPMTKVLDNIIRDYFSTGYRVSLPESMDKAITGKCHNCNTVIYLDQMASEGYCPHCESVVFIIPS
jgi:Zn finger protein HypA/HybF involved in hydrogenase expression